MNKLEKYIDRGLWYRRAQVVAIVMSNRKSGLGPELRAGMMRQKKNDQVKALSSRS